MRAVGTVRVRWWPYKREQGANVSGASTTAVSRLMRLMIPTYRLELVKSVLPIKKRYPESKNSVNANLASGVLPLEVPGVPPVVVIIGYTVQVQQRRSASWSIAEYAARVHSNSAAISSL